MKNYFLNNQTLSNNRNGNLLRSILLTLLASCSGIAYCQIVYVDINPDTTISEIGGHFDLDLNNNGTFDFTISRFGLGEYNSVDIAPLHDSCHTAFYSLDGGIYAIAFNEGDLIDSTTDWFTEMQGVNLANWGGITTGMHSGAFNGENDKFIGLQLIEDGQVYYGWVRADVAFDATWFRLKDYASDRGEIVAGDGITGLPLNHGQPEFSVYPNPTTGKVLINTSLDEDLTVEVTNSGGQILLKSKLQPSGILDFSTFCKGIYIVKIYGHETHWVQKVIKK